MTKQAWLVGFAVTGVLACGTPVAAPEAESISAATQTIRGGDDAHVGEFPYHVRILGRGVTKCGGALVQPGWVVTSAHCLQGFTASELTVVMGEVRIDVTEPTQQARSVMRWIPHPDYGVVDDAPLHDVAVIQVAQPFIVTTAVSPVAFPSGPPNIGTSLTVTGWGTSGTGGGTTTQLKYASMPVSPPTNCAWVILRNPVEGAELCMVLVNQRIGACQGDEGDPLVLNGKLHGVMSWDGTGGCQQFTIFTNVANYVTWIRSYTG
ncbi:trypsin-like serine protease [Myxococcus sp. CA040A]|uniref:S1 family peptidase n=1 Tax=Myxococcus sp. CA040A TaxID=2741738 RepID=UPI00157B0DC1|nr:serine protease [Myxococcus sp. CA040A]NTX08768.1 serine protease [Myxococcus sp. CA040A]